MGIKSYEITRKTDVATVGLVGLYLVAIVTANWLVSRFGPSVSIWTAFGFIGLNLTTRDHLHDAWQGPRLKRYMFLLIASGSLLSIPFNAGRIAAASFGAFALSETLDAIVYHKLGGWPRWVKINGSNVVSAALDSVTFPAFAFGFPLLFGIMTGQFVAKVGGGFLWSLLLAAL